MNRNKNPHFKAEQVDTTSVILILGKEYPLLVTAISDYITSYGGTAISKFEKELSVDYLLIFDENNQVNRYINTLKPGGKLLHVVSTRLHRNSETPDIDTYFLSPAKTFKTNVIVRKLLSRLYTAKNYYPPKKKQIKKKKINKDIYKKPEIKNQLKRVLIKSAITVAVLLAIMSAPVIAWTTSVGISLYSLNYVRDTDLTLKAQTKWADRSVIAASTASQIQQLFYPIVSRISPNTAIIIESHTNILTSVTTTAKISLKQQSVLKSFANTIISKESNQIANDIKQVKQSISVVKASLEPAVKEVQKLRPYQNHKLVSPVWEYYEKLPVIDETLSDLYAFSDHIPSMFAVKTRKKYLVLFQNNFEIRPTGGFIGSYAILTMENGTIKDIAVEDVYEADGQLKGQVDPPEPLIMYLNQPNWFLRDSNWNPDFALSARQAEWFIEKEVNEQVDGVIAVDLYVLKNILEALDGVYVPDYQAKVYANDFFYKLQNDNHDQFFAGSNKKRNLIDALATALLIDIEKQDAVTLVKIGASLHKSLSTKHLLLYMHDQEMQETIEKLSWGGRVVSNQNILDQSSNTYVDYMMVVDANLGVNKVNYSIKRELYTTIDIYENLLSRQLIIYYKNTSRSNDDSLYGGTYKNYVRILIPSEAEIQSIMIGTDKTNILGSTTIESYQDKKIIGLLVEIPPETDKKVIVRYSLENPTDASFSYQLMVQKQLGSVNDPFIFKLGKNAQKRLKSTSVESLPYLTSLEKDQLINVDFASLIK